MLKFTYKDTKGLNRLLHSFAKKKNSKTPKTCFAGIIKLC